MYGNNIQLKVFSKVARPMLIIQTLFGDIWFSWFQKPRFWLANQIQWLKNIVFLYMSLTFCLNNLSKSWIFPCTLLKVHITWPFEYSLQSCDGQYIVILLYYNVSSIRRCELLPYSGLFSRGQFFHKSTYSSILRRKFFTNHQEHFTITCYRKHFENKIFLNGNWFMKLVKITPQKTCYIVV